MAIVFVAESVDLPSEEWMRRMLFGLKSDIALVVTERYCQILATASIPARVIAVPPLWRRLANRMRLVRRSPWNDFQARAMKSVLSRTDVTAVLVQFLTTAVKYEEAWSTCSKPVMVHCHGYDVTWDLRQHNGTPRHRIDYVDRIRRLPLNVSFIANSLVTRQRLLEIGINDERIHVKYLGVPLSNRLASRSVTNECVVLYVGRLVDCKGPDLVIQAFDLACKRGFRGRLILAGDGDLRITCELLRARSRFKHRIDMLGVVDAVTVSELLGKCDIFTAHNCKGPLTNQEEAFGVSIVEAMGAGLPVVSGRSGSLTEIVEDGSQGILFDPGDLEAHAEALLQLAASPELRNAMGRSGRARAEGLFSIDKEIRELRRLLGLDDCLSSVTS